MTARILALLKDTEDADIILPLTEEVAIENNAELILAVTCAQRAGSVDPTESSSPDERIAEQVRKKHRLMNSGSSLIITAVSRPRWSLRDIRKYSDQNRITLVAEVLRKRLRRSRPRADVGMRLLRRSGTPVLLVSAGTKQHPGGETKIKNILVALDGSKRDEAAIRYGGALALALGVEMSLLRVVEERCCWQACEAPMSFRKIAHDDQLKMAKARDYLGVIQAACTQEGIRASIKVEYGDPAACIAGCATTQDAGLIVLSSRRNSNIGRILAGSVTEGVLDASDVPVLSVPAPS